PAAFEALVRRHGPMVLGVCRRVLRDADDADDAFQATFLVLVRKSASIARRELLANWLYGVAYRAALEARSAAARRGARERQVSEMPEPEAPAVVSEPDMRPLLDQEINKLPDKYRVAIVLCYLEGRPRKEVARQLGVPDGTLSGRLTTARRMLARRLARHGLAMTTAAAVLTPRDAWAGVPPSLMASTTSTAIAFVAGGSIPANLSVLTQGVFKTMFLTKPQLSAKVVLALVLVGAPVLSLTRAEQTTA